MSVAQVSGPVSFFWNLILSAPLVFFGTVLLSLPIIVIAIRSNGNTEERSGGQRRTVWMVPYWIPVVGHSFQFLYDPMKLMDEARDRSAHGVFALNLGMRTYNIISNPRVVASVMQQEESILQSRPSTWDVVHKFYGVPKRYRAKYSVVWNQLQSTLEHLMQEPYLGDLIKSTMRNLEENIPQMISFTDSDIDLQPWERSAEASYISNSEMEINLMVLVRDMLGTASIPAVFGRGLIEKHPSILHDIHDMDDGKWYFMMGIPSWTPWPPITRAYLARRRVWQGLDGLQEALDATVDGKNVDSSWGDLDDVSKFIMKRHALYKENGFGITERSDISVLWSLVANADLITYWHLIHVLASPGLVDRLRSEISPYAQVTKPTSIGGFAEAPKLTIFHEGLAKKCPLFRATYFEAMRLSARPSSTRKVAVDITIPGDTDAKDSPSYILHKGDYVTVKHGLHMRDPKYFEDPETFNPERFMVHNEDGTSSVDMGTIRPYGGGQSICKGRIYAERECLALVAGILVCWDIEPTDKKAGWVIPKQKRTGAVCRPVRETRVRIRPRSFTWDS